MVVQPEHVHAYKSGNYAPIQTEISLVPCKVIGLIPRELNGMYVRNGSNPSASSVNTSAKEPSYHWFDGDGMLSGVVFNHEGSDIIPSFVNKFVLTDILLSSTSSTPILPSIATLLGPLSALPTLLHSISRAVASVGLSRFSKTPIDRISVANTAILYHDGRALATCESGPPMVVRLPGLETENWWSLEGDETEQIGLRENSNKLIGWMREWCTAHPKRDPKTGELLVFHSTLLPPYLHYSVIPPSTLSQSNRILAAPISLPGSRMMHDFGVSLKHTIILDMPLSLDPLNLLRGVPVVAYDPTVPSRFGIFERLFPGDVRWYDAPPCIIFHTGNTWTDESRQVVELLCCRMNSSMLVYAAGNIPLPPSEILGGGELDTCELYYFQFPLSAPPLAIPSQQFSISKIPFEFPALPPKLSMSASKFIYGCTLSSGSFSAALGTAAKIDSLAKVNTHSLIARGIREGVQWNESVDNRSVEFILSTQIPRIDDQAEVDIRIFLLPAGYFAQECSFIPREIQRDEDDGFLLTYVFDESQLDSNGIAKLNSKSELWIIDAWDMKTILAKILLPQRVPYGLHGTWFTRKEIEEQRKSTGFRSRDLERGIDDVGWGEQLRTALVKLLG